MVVKIPLKPGNLQSIVGFVIRWFWKGEMWVKGEDGRWHDSVTWEARP